MNGRIWIGSYPGADLTVYDPKTGEFTRYGRMSSVDKYNYPLVAPDGKIACLIRQTRPHVVVFDPSTRGSVFSQDRSRSRVRARLSWRGGRDGNLYVITSDYGNFLVSGNEGIAVATLPGKMPRPALPDGSTFAFSDGTEQIYRTLSIRRPFGSVRTFELDYEGQRH